tara:strand:+ start:154 stop:843 length:690 start_codon:yes stop_codon:yes gene_type:complete
VVQESTHRANELTALGWHADDVSRYVELWDYRQRWGAINLEREDRQFLKKAESALPQIQTGRVSPRKPIQEKSYYKRLRFFVDSFDSVEKDWSLEKGSRGAWPILLEEEMRVLDYYEPVLGLPDTLKSKAIEPLREEIIKNLRDNVELNTHSFEFNFEEALEKLKATENSKWRPLRETTTDNSYLVLASSSVTKFRNEVRSNLPKFIKELFPSLVDTKKPSPPDDWVRE